MEHTHAFLGIGTRWTIDSDLALTPGLIVRIDERIRAFDRTYSRFRADSLVAQLSRAPGTFDFPDEARALFTLYRQLHDCTNGAVTPLVGAALEHLGYGIGYRLVRNSGHVPVPRWDDVMVIDGSTVSTSEPVLLDVGAAGKGHLVDLIAQLLDEEGLTGYVIDASGDLIHRGVSAERIGMEDPTDPAQVVGVARIRNEALCASATSRRQWGDRLHHIIDPTTSAPTRGVLASWVTHSSCAVADGLATALFLSAPDELNRVFDYSYARLDRSGSLDYSSNFDGELFT